MVPKSLEDDSDAMDIDGDDISDGAQYPTVVVCSGELVEKVRCGSISLDDTSNLVALYPLGRSPKQPKQSYLSLFSDSLDLCATYWFCSRTICRAFYLR